MGQLQWPLALQGTCAEKCALDQGITREKQDEYSLESYKRSKAAAAAGAFVTEITPVKIVRHAELLQSTTPAPPLTAHCSLRTTTVQSGAK